MILGRFEGMIDDPEGFCNPFHAIYQSVNGMPMKSANPYALSRMSLVIQVYRMNLLRVKAPESASL